MSFSVSTAEVGGDAQGQDLGPRPAAGWGGQEQGLQLFRPTGVHGECHASLWPLCVQHASAFHTFTHLLVCTLFLVYLPSHPLALWEACWGPAFLPFLLPCGPISSLALVPHSSLLYLDTLSTHHPSVYVCICSRVHMCVLLCMCICMNVYIHLCVHVCVCSYVCILA